MISVGNVQKSKIIRSGILAAVLLFMGVSYNALCVCQASALSLGSLKVNAPLGSTLKPLTDTTNQITEALPLKTTLQSQPDQLGVSLNLPILSSSTPESAPTVALNVPLPGVSETLDNVTRPVNSLVQSLPRVTNPIRPPQETPPSPTSPSDGSSSPETTNPSTTATTSEKATAEDTGKGTPQNESPFTGVTSFFSSTLPDALRRFASGLAGKPVDLLPVIVSSLILLLTLGAVGGIIFASNRGGILTFGHFGQINLTKFTETHDIAQFASLIIAIIGFGTVVSFLVLTGF